MKEKFTKQELLLLRLALEHEAGVLVGQLTLKCGSSVREVVQAFKNLNELGFLRLDNDLITLTTLGKNWINDNQHLFAFSGEKVWREVPKDFRAPKISPLTPYAPRRSRLIRKLRHPGQAAKGE